MGFNAKLFEVMLYPDSYDLDLLPVLLEQLPGVRDYAYCVHDRDEGKKAHCHVMLRMKDTRNSDRVASWFQANPSQIEKCKGRWADMLAYLTHANAPDKFQYEPECVHSNFDWLTESKKAGNKGNARLNELLEGIGAGEIRRFNVFKYMTVQEYAKYKARLNIGFEYREKKMKGVNREMQGFYVYGDSSTGKTTWAKLYAEMHGYSVFVSSGSNDILDGYEGQDCIILDDLRPSSLGLSDLLKMLDPHTSSTVNSRYYNKTLECKVIIITTTLPMENFFRQVFENEAEPLKQLERRCQRVLYMTREKMFLKIYDPKLERYIHSDPAPNTVWAANNVESLTEDDVVQIENDMYMVASKAIKELRSKGDSAADKAADVIQDVFDQVKEA